MTIFAPSPTREILQAPISSRSDFTLALVQLCLETGADHYMILDIPNTGGGEPAHVLASNWVYDTIEIIGLDLIAGLFGTPFVTPAGQTPKPVETGPGGQLSGILPDEQILRLAHLGHGELYCLRLNAGRQRYFALLSARAAGRMQADAVMAAQLSCCYMLSEMATRPPVPDVPNPLSERERECLFWAAEGKTAEETALILDVSNNTVNGYMQQAIRKLAAPNRAKAIAIAVRSGLV
jgi:DNA-binding CsgD family transcriptional regulator